MYVGQTIHDPKIRFLQHINAAKRQSGNPIHRAIRKYGQENFELIIFKECLTLDELNFEEVRFIKELNTINKGYNIAIGGAGYHTSGVWNHSDETKLKISKGNSGKVRSDDVKKRISESVQLSYQNNPELKMICGSSRRGKKNSPKQIEVLRQSVLGEKNCNWNKFGSDHPCGGPKTVAHCKKISEGKKGWNPSEVTRLRMSESRSQAVVAIDPVTNAIIMKFHSIKSVSNFGFSQMQVNRVALGQCKKHKGFIWKKVADLSEFQKVDIESMEWS
jgi:group I intron endonuclease